MRRAHRLDGVLEERGRVVGRRDARGVEHGVVADHEARRTAATRAHSSERVPFSLVE